MQGNLIPVSAGEAVDAPAGRRAADRPGYLIKQAQAALHAEMARVLRGQDVTMAQFAVITALAEEPGLSNAELARRAFITPQSMNENLRELERRGFITRHPHPSHGRILRIELTDLGRSTQTACDEAVTIVEDRMLGGLDTRQRDQLVKALKACVNVLTAGGA